MGNRISFYRRAYVHAVVFTAGFVFPCLAPALDGIETDEFVDSLPIESEVPSEAGQRISPATEAPRAYSVERPWLLNTSAGPTAFVLESQTFQVGLEREIYQQKLSIPGSFLGLKYGLTSGLDLGVAPKISFDTAGRPIAFEVKWNFLNSGSWSYAIRPIGVLQVGSSGYYAGSAKAFAVALAASYVEDDEHKWHFSLTVGKNINKTDWSQSVYWVTRATVAYEWRLSAQQGVLFSVSPQLVGSEYQWGYSYYGNSNDTQKGMVAGVGYQFVSGRFGAAVGVEAGPTWNRWGFQALDMLAITSAIDFRL